MICVISAQDDPHLPFVARHLERNSYIVVDPVKDAAKGALDYVLSQGRWEVWYNGQRLEHITSVWYRRPSAAEELASAVPAPYQNYSVSALSRHALALNYAWSGARWVSDFQAIRRAGIKPLQLGRAAETGFKVPDTVFVSGEKMAKDFLSVHSQVIAKPQSMRMLDNAALYATLLTREDDVSFAGLRHDPYILQQYIEPVAEYRVTVVEGQVFAATIQYSQDATEGLQARDWRRGLANNSLKIEPIQLPDGVEEACRKLVKSFGLLFGAIDLIEDKHGAIWFIEINPNGQRPMGVY